MLGLILLATTLVTVWLGARGLQAREELEAARADLSRAKDALLDLDVELATAAVDRAAERTTRARALTQDPVWRFASAIPGLGRTPATVWAATVAADDVARRVLPPALAAAGAVDLDRVRRPDGSVDLAMIKAASGQVALAASAARTVDTDMAALQRESVAAPVLDGLDAVSGQVTALSEALTSAEQALTVLPPLLGSDRPRTYLAFVQQTGESRGTGGLIGGYVLLRTDAGRIEVLEQGSNQGLRPGRVAVPPGVPPDYVERYEPFGSFETWGTANLSPDLPNVARVLNARWQAQGRTAVDGVVMLDAVALELILQGGPPVPLEDGRLLPVSELVEYLSVGQYADFVSEPDGKSRSRDRKDQLDAIAATAARRLGGGDADPEALVRGLVDAARSGHVRMASDDPALQPLLAAAGMDGALPDGGGPLAYPVITNASGSKLDNWLERSVIYRGGPCAGGRRSTTVAVSLSSAVPAEPLPPYLTIRLKAGGGKEDSRDINVLLTVYGTPGADLRRATLDGRPVAPEDPQGAFLAAGNEAGLPLWETYLELPPGTSRQLLLELNEPALPGPAAVPEQPLQRPLRTELSVPACR